MAGGDLLAQVAAVAGTVHPAGGRDGAEPDNVRPCRCFPNRARIARGGAFGDGAGAPDDSGRVEGAEHQDPVRHLCFVPRVAMQVDDGVEDGRGGERRAGGSASPVNRDGDHGGDLPGSRGGYGLGVGRNNHQRDKNTSDRVDGASQRGRDRDEGDRHRRGVTRTAVSTSSPMT